MYLGIPNSLLDACKKLKKKKKQNKEEIAENKMILKRKF